MGYKIYQSLEGGMASKHLVDSGNVKGGFCVVADATELAALPVASQNEDGVVVEGSLAYNRATKKFYQYQQVSESPATYAWVEANLGGGSAVETLFVSSYNLFSKVIGGETQLSSLTAIKHSYSATSITESDLIANVSLVLDAHNAMAVYVGKTNQDQYVFTTVSVNIQYTYDSVNDIYTLHLNGDSCLIDGDIIPSGDHIMALGSSEHGFYVAYIGQVMTGSVVAKTQYNGLQWTAEFTHNDEQRAVFKLFVPNEPKGGAKGGGGQNYELVLPQRSGTLAMDADIPDISGKAPNNHASSATTYGVGTSSNYGHVKLGAANQNGATAANGVAAPNGHTHSQYLTSHQDISGKAPNNHASSATTYGVGTSSNYGHVKLGAANQNGATAANGVAAPNGHTHSQYLTSHQSLINLGFARTAFYICILDITFGTGSIQSVSVINIYGNLQIQTYSGSWSYTIENPSASFGAWVKFSGSAIYRGCGISNGSKGQFVMNGTGNTRTSGLMPYSSSSSQYVALPSSSGQYLIFGY